MDIFWKFRGFYFKLCIKCQIFVAEKEIRVDAKKIIKC